MESRDFYNMRTGESNQKPGRLLTPAEFKRRAAACGGILLATGVAAVAFIDSDERKSTERAICEGEQQHTIESGDGMSHLLAEVDGGINNPNDAADKMRELNPSLNPALFETKSSPILPEGVTVILPEECFSENANRPANR